MGQKRVRHSVEFKAKVALEDLRGLKTVNELEGQYQVHPTQISQWKRQVQVGARELFGTTCAKGDQEHETGQAKLYEEVGRLKMEFDWIKKLPGSVEGKRQWIVPGHPQLNIRRQCALLDLG
jgi:putative transposase